MISNRQIGLDGKVFVSTCLKRGAIFVFILLAGGIATAVADILKLTGASGAVMSSFTTTLLLYDFIVSLMLVVVLFYAYFLECGTSVPILREKPLLVFGFFRLGYYILLSYYICYRALYCLTHSEEVRFSMFIFYALYFLQIFCCILADSFVFNVLTRNVIRRSYKKSFHTLATVGMIVQALLPIAYLIARFTMKDAGDEFFTRSLCDTLRLCICPLAYFCVWFLFIESIKQVDRVFDEVDDALRNRRYQITYAAIEDGKKSDKKKTGAKPVAAAFLPAPAKTDGAPEAIKGAAEPVIKVNNAPAAAQPVAPVKSPAEQAMESMTEQQRKAAQATITDAATVYNNDAQPADDAAQQRVTQYAIPLSNITQKGGTTYAYVTDMRPVEQGGQPTVRAIPVVEEFDPYPDAQPHIPQGNQRLNPHPAQNKGQQNRGQQNRNQHNKGQNNRPQQNRNNHGGQQNRNGQNRQGTQGNRQGGQNNRNSHGSNNSGKGRGGNYPHPQQRNKNGNQNRNGHR